MEIISMKRKLISMKWKFLSNIGRTGENNKERAGEPPTCPDKSNQSKCENF